MLSVHSVLTDARHNIAVTPDPKILNTSILLYQRHYDCRINFN